VTVAEESRRYDGMGRDEKYEFISTQNYTSLAFLPYSIILFMPALFAKLG